MHWALQGQVVQKKNVTEGRVRMGWAECPTKLLAQSCSDSHPTPHLLEQK